MPVMNKVLITGGAGYIGTTLIPLLFERGYEVTVFDSLLFGGDAILPFFRDKNFHFIKGDVRDKEALQKAVKGQDIIVHLAAIVGFPASSRDPELTESVNVGGTRNLANVLEKNQYVLVGSTGSNYGAVLDGVCTEETPLNPLSVYGRTKTESEKILMETGRSTAFRFATAFGVAPRMRLDLLINDLTEQAMRLKYLLIYEGHFMRTFIHVQDLARSFLFAIDNQSKMIGQVYNVGDDRLNYSKRQICDMIAARTGAYVHYADVGTDIDKRNYVVSYEKIRSLGYTTTISVEEGIDELVRAIPALKIPHPYSNA